VTEVWGWNKGLLQSLKGSLAGGYPHKGDIIFGEGRQQMYNLAKHFNEPSREVVESNGGTDVI
jgi:hypothetical protein